MGKNARDAFASQCEALIGHLEASSTLMRTGQAQYREMRDGQWHDITAGLLALNDEHVRSLRQWIGGDYRAPADQPPAADRPFWVFEAKPMNRARIHRRDCRHCNNGTGQPNQLKKDGGRSSATKWTPFDSLSAAIDWMNRQGHKDTGLCSDCLSPAQP